MTITADTPVTEGSALPRLTVVTLVSVALLWVAFYLYQLAQPTFAAIVLALATGFAIVFGANKFYGGRFIFPGVAAVLIFIAFPVLYTIYIGFTNYSSFNLLTYDRTVEVLTSRGSVDEEASLAPADTPATLLERRDAIKLRGGLQGLTLTTPDGAIIQNAGLRTFATVTPDYVQTGPDELTKSDGTVLTADHTTGFFLTAEGEQVPPGWRVNIGWDNFSRVFNSEGIRAPMVSIFIWTFVFAGASVVLTFALGLTLAVILQWEHPKRSTASC